MLTRARGDEWRLPFPIERIAVATNHSDAPYSDAALILFSHGSLLCGAGRTLLSHAARIRERGLFAAVEIGYLNYSEPSFEAAVDACAARGVLRIVVVPYFLVEGRFVTADLPPRVAAASVRHPNLRIALARAVADSPSVCDAIRKLVLAAVPLGEAANAHFAIPSDECRNDPQCPLHGTSACPSFVSGRIRA